MTNNKNTTNDVDIIPQLDTKKQEIDTTQTDDGLPVNKEPHPQFDRLIPCWNADINELSNKEAALFYAWVLGWQVVPLHEALPDGSCTCDSQRQAQAQKNGKSYTPCASQGKHPRTQNGIKDATNDVDTILEWWSLWSSANIGLNCGTSGILALDLDTYKAEYAGDDSLSLIDTVTSVTGSGGQHLLFQMPRGKEWGNGTGSLPAGIDVRGVNGIIVLSPSNHKSGNEYAWDSAPNQGKIIALPQEFRDMFERIEREKIKRVERVKDNDYSKPDVKKIQAALGYISALTSYENWLQILMAVHSEYPNDIGITLCEEWSLPYYQQYGMTDDNGEVEKKFASFSGSGVSVGTLFHHAKANGWQPIKVTKDTLSGTNVMQVHTPEDATTPASFPSFFMDGIPEVDETKVIASIQRQDLGYGELVKVAWGSQIRYDHSLDQWYVWDGIHWAENDKGSFKAALMDKLSELIESTYEAVKERCYEESVEPRKELEEKQAERTEALSKLNTDGLSKKDRTEKQQKTSKPFDELIAVLRDEIDAIMKPSKAFWSKEGPRWAKPRQVTGINKIMTVVQSLLGSNGEEWDQQPMLFPVANGVVCLKTGELLPTTPEMMIRTFSPIEYTGKDTDAPEWGKAVYNIFCRDEELLRYTQSVVGMAMMGKVSEHILPFFCGTGGNGKDTFLRQVSRMFGPLGGVVSNGILIKQGTQNPDGAQPHIMHLKGMRLAYVSETSQGEKLDDDQAKLLTGGGEIEARPLYGKKVTWNPTHTLFMSTNKLPHLDASDPAIWRRARLIEFKATFSDNPEPENNVYQKINEDTLIELFEQESSGILAWLVRGCLMYQEHGLQTPDSVLASTQSYRDSEDELGHFLEDCCVVGPQYKIFHKDLYSEYKIWYTDNHDGGKAMRKKVFEGKLDIKGIEKKENQYITHFQMSHAAYIGVALVSPLNDTTAKKCSITAKNNANTAKMQDDISRGRDKNTANTAKIEEKIEKLSKEKKLPENGHHIHRPTGLEIFTQKDAVFAVLQDSPEVESPAFLQYGMQENAGNAVLPVAPVVKVDISTEHGKRLQSHIDYYPSGRLTMFFGGNEANISNDVARGWIEALAINPDNAVMGWEV